MPFYINRNFENQLFEYLSSMQSWNIARPVNLGGWGGPGGGSGGPPGGFIGQLPQYRVTYDTTELGTMYTPVSGFSLVDNLNHIRYRIGILETASGGGGGSGGSPIGIEWNNTPISSNITVLNFEGGVEVVENSPGHVTITVTASESVSGSGINSMGYFYPIEHYYTHSGSVYSINHIMGGQVGIIDSNWEIIQEFPILASGIANIYWFADTSTNNDPASIGYWLGFYHEGSTDTYDTFSGTVTLSGRGCYGDYIHIAGPVNVLAGDCIWFSTSHDVGEGTNTAWIYGAVLTISGAFGGGGGSSYVKPTHQTIFTIAGDLSVESNPLRIYNKLGDTQTISEVFLAVGTPPTGSGIKVDIHKNGTTIFTSQSNRPEITVGSYTGNTTNIDVSNWASNEYLTAHVDQVGASTPGSDLVIHVIHK